MRAKRLALNIAQIVIIKRRSHAGIIIACIAGGCCILAACLALCAHHNREGKHDKQAKPWEPSHSGPAPHSLDLVSTKEHGDDVPEAIRKLEANNDDAV